VEHVRRLALGLLPLHLLSAAVLARGLSVASVVRLLFVAPLSDEVSDQPEDLASDTEQCAEHIALLSGTAPRSRAARSTDRADDFFEAIAIAARFDCMEVGAIGPPRCLCFVCR